MHRPGDNSRSSQSLRAVLVPLMMLAGVIVAAKGFVDDRRQVSMESSTVSPQEWPLKFNIPSGWSFHENTTDFPGSQMLVFYSPRNDMALKVRRFVPVGEMKPIKAFNWIVTKYESIHGSKFNRVIEPHQAWLAGWKGVVGELYASPDRPGYTGVQMFLMVVVEPTNSEEVPAVYTIELQVPPPVDNQVEAIWQSILDNIEISEGTG